MRVVVVTGKGGVGKVSLAAATALAAAQRGTRALLISTDAAHSLWDVLNRPVDVEPGPIIDNLDGLQHESRCRRAPMGLSLAMWLHLRQHAGRSS